MQQNLPRLILAGTNSGCGKTTVTCAVLQALVNRGLSVAAAKCGPDYIDPMVHSRIIGAKSSNLDPFIFEDCTLRFLLAQTASGCDVKCSILDLHNIGSVHAIAVTCDRKITICNINIALFFIICIFRMNAIFFCG